MSVELHTCDDGAKDDWNDSLTGARSGRDEALGELLERYYPYLMLVAQGELNGSLKSKVGASDLVQETVVRACGRFHQFQGHTCEEFQAWLRRILVNVAAMAQRQYWATKRQVGRERTLAEPVVASRDPTPSSILATREEIERVEQAVKRLPEDSQKVILLRHREGLPFADVARRMGRSEGAVQKLWSRAVRRLQQELRKDGVCR